MVETLLGVARDFEEPDVIENAAHEQIATQMARGCRCFGGPLGSLSIASPPCSTGVDGGLGGASRLYASICVEPDGVLPGVSLR
uniref:Uncharacterized protein n=1 Tax=Chromera velia CCMP2878 TaxID=1169474 RepID=A0A0G4HV68_9ALVE|eukprot:Cvel_8754.t1-p1 / transcript=Cvel_8754.t1 / gene=Cvel_8754 / organism=Chromera_velia_CCMP2878 / gene_product=hypothetical protein / transcript_product=hypothetical protein / location=Cvel_scaffold489:68094-69977(-) / protein_length=83 / sequence_SO=supercontig / SO=protein_coding / is_pseudo=false